MGWLLIVGALSYLKRLNNDISVNIFYYISASFLSWFIGYSILAPFGEDDILTNKKGEKEFSFKYIIVGIIIFILLQMMVSQIVKELAINHP